MTKLIRANYARICAECIFSKSVVGRSDVFLCERVRDVVTGRPAYTNCRTQRAMSGSCRPDGLLFEARAKQLIAAE